VSESAGIQVACEDFGGSCARAYKESLLGSASINYPVLVKNPWKRNRGNSNDAVATVFNQPKLTSLARDGANNFTCRFQQRRIQDITVNM
jgi:hypothetical protein